MLWSPKAQSKTKTQAFIQKQWVEHYALSYSRWILEFGSYLSIHVGYLAKWRSVRSSSCTKTCRNALSKQMTSVVNTWRVKMKSQLRKFFWHHSAECKNQILAKCLIGESSNLTARFRSSGHYELDDGWPESEEKYSKICNCEDRIPWNIERKICEDVSKKEDVNV